MKAYISEHELQCMVPWIDEHTVESGGSINLHPNARWVRIWVDEDAWVSFQDAAIRLAADTPEWFAISKEIPRMAIRVMADEE